MSLPKKSILIVDNEYSVRTAVKAVLMDKYDVSEVESAQKALEHMAVKATDLVLLDIKMPGIDGFEALKIIKKKHPESLIVMLSAYSFDDNVRKAKELGAAGFVTKAFEVDALRSYLDKVLSENPA